jgi:hypothetical protein
MTDYKSEIESLAPCKELLETCIKQKTVCSDKIRYDLSLLFNSSEVNSKEVT